MRKSNPSQTTLDLLYAIPNGLLEDPVGHAMHRAIEFGVAGNTEIGWLRERVTRHKTAQLFAGPFSQVPSTRGEIVVGNDLKGRPIRMSVQALCAHTLTLGGSGSGKTTKSRWMILQAARFVSGLWMFDFRKREYRCLVPWLEAMGLETIVVPARSLRLNPLQVPPGVDPRSWASRVADMLVTVLRLPQRATKLVNLTMLDLFDHSGVRSRAARCPTLFDLREAIAANKEANSQARSAVVDALDPVLLSLREVLCYRRGWSSRDLANHHIVLEFDGITEVEKDLLLSSLVLPEFTRRVAGGVSNARMDLLICCDEAARLVSASGSGGGIGDLVGLIRGTGIGLEMSVQVSDIAPAILSNSATKFIGRCGSSADYNTMAEAMGLATEQRRCMAQTLVPGMFVGQFGEGTWRQPFLFRVPNVDFAKPPGHAQGVSPFVRTLLPTPTSGGIDDQAAPDFAGYGMKTLLALPTEAAEEFRDWRPSDRSVAWSRGTQRTVPQASLSAAERRYLQAIVDHPAQPSGRYAALAGIGIHQAITLRRALVERGYLREHTVNTGRRGRASIVLEPLPVALAALGIQEGAS